MSNIESMFIDYFSFFVDVSKFWSASVEKSTSVLQPLFNQTEQLRLCSRAQLDKVFLEKFPGIKDRLMGKILFGIEEEMLLLIKFVEEMKSYVDGLKIRLNSLEKAFSGFNPEEPEFNPIIPSFDKLMEYALDVWRCFHVLCIGVKASINMLDYYEKESLSAVSNAFTKYKQVEKKLQYISDITYYLRTQQDGQEKK